MTRYLFVLVLSFVFVSNLMAQPAVGHTTVTFNDPTRSGGFGSGGGPGRQIQTEIYYPATTAGDNTTAEAGQFPVVIFGHGFLMGWDAYDNIWNKLVEKGYIVALPRTEGGLSPSHNDFGLDLALLVSKMQGLNTAVGSPLMGHVAAPTAVGGHSMGGGASVLAAGAPGVSAHFALAPAETTPSAIAAAAQVTVPSVIFSGSGDGVTPPAQHQIPIYNALVSTCKYHITISGGGHCYFANTSLTCDLGELLTIDNVTISREAQHQVTFEFLVPWLEFWLSGFSQGIADINLGLTNNPGVTVNQSCINPLGTEETAAFRGFVVFPNPAQAIVEIRHGQDTPCRVQVMDFSGRVLSDSPLTASVHTIDISGLTPGVYVLRIENARGQASHHRVVKE